MYNSYTHVRFKATRGQSDNKTNYGSHSASLSVELRAFFDPQFNTAVLTMNGAIN